MKQAGRVSWLVLFAILGLGILVGLVVLSGGSPSSAANQFLEALHDGDVATLTDLTYLPSGSKDEMKKKWEYTTKVAAPFYNFAWKVQWNKTLPGDQAVVQVSMTKNSEVAYSAPENFQIPMVRDGGRWKVDVFSLSRKFYPALPRPEFSSK